MNLQRSVKGYLSKIKSSALFRTFTSGNRFVRSCRPFSIDRQMNCKEKEAEHEIKDQSAKLSDIDHFLRENFRSLYQSDNEEDVKGEENYKKKEGVESNNSSLSSSPQNFSLQYGESNNFYMAPQRSDSSTNGVNMSFLTSCTITNSKDIGSSSTPNKTLKEYFEISDEEEYMGNTLSDDYIAVLKYSPMPHNDFRCSMQEIVEAKLQSSAEIEWEDMEEILFYFLKLNDKNSYDFILSAFVDTMSAWRERTGESSTNLQTLQRAKKSIRRILRAINNDLN
ncbi:hypothetical protein ACFE04_021796 [Oxalis oulophora]